MGGDLVRNDVRVVLGGEDAECSLNGLYLARNREHVDTHTSIDHAVPHTRSRELYRGILDGRARGAFDGAILVRRDAQKTSAAQENRNLLLSDDAVIHTKPELQIQADDVKCTHGATIGQLDREAVFYLRARGFDEPAARRMLTRAFAADVLEAAKPAEAAEAAGHLVTGWLDPGPETEDRP
jgi:Fe-S cluster assembly protein SufD